MSDSTHLSVETRPEKLTFIEVGVTPLWEDNTLMELERLINRKHEPYLDNEAFSIAAGRLEDRIYLKTTLKKTDESWHYPVECVAFFRDKDPREVALLIFDYLDCYWTEYLTDGRDTYVTLEWSTHNCEGQEFFLRGFVRQTALEEEADRFLAAHGHGDHVINSISSET